MKLLICSKDTLTDACLVFIPNFDYLFPFCVRNFAIRDLTVRKFNYQIGKGILISWKTTFKIINLFHIAKFMTLSKSLTFFNVTKLTTELKYLKYYSVKNILKQLNAFNV